MLDTIIIGAGPAGLTAAIYAIRYGLKIAVFDKGIYGGQIAVTSKVENYPAISEITGAELSESLYNHAVKLGMEIKFENIESVSLSQKLKLVKTSENEYQSHTVIIANGVKRRLLNCDGEQKFKGKGVSYCATCDGAFFKNKDVAIVGGGNTALEDAVLLSNLCNRVYIIHRRDKFRAEKFLIDSVNARKNIEILYNYTVEKIDGDETVKSIELQNKINNKVETLKLDGVFVAIGFEPDNQIFDELKLDSYGYIVAGENCITNIAGVFVAGDSRTKILRQIITAASDGAMAAYQASNYLMHI